jgi:copper ion binding protein
VSKKDYTVRGMTCDHCAGSVTAEINKITGVIGVRVDVKAGRVTVEADEAVPDGAIAEAVEEAGYQVTPRPASSDAGARKAAS